MRKNLLITGFILLCVWIITFLTFYMQAQIGLFPEQLPMWIWLLISLGLITLGVYLKEKGLFGKEGLDLS